MRGRVQFSGDTGKLHPTPYFHSVMRGLIPRACLLGWMAVPSAQEPDSRPNLSSQSERVVLHVAVKDKRGGYVAGLGRDAFHVLENRRPQEISFFHDQDAPVTVGMLI